VGKRRDATGEGHISMDYPSLSEVRSLVEEANVLRWRGDASGGDNVSDARRAERRLDDLFGTARALATYGTLAPGRPNQHHSFGPWTELRGGPS
jgi:hypothetical protein